VLRVKGRILRTRVGAAGRGGKVAIAIGTYPAISDACRTTASAVEGVFSEGLGYEREVVFVVEVAGVLA